MKSVTFKRRLNAAGLMIRAFVAAFLATLLPVAATRAQTEKVTDGMTPSGLTLGAPVGSYALSGFESVNPYNGGLNFSLPLLTVGGRGGAGYSVTLRIDQKWIIRKQFGDNQGDKRLQYIPTPLWLDEFGGMEQTFSVGKLTARQAGSRNFVIVQGSNCGQVHQYTLTRLTFTAPDGTEYELRDTLRDGQPHLTNATTCQSGSFFNRGKVFVTADGTSATFIADSDVTDYPYNNPGEGAPAGYMILKDGTRFRVGASNAPPGSIAWMRDRNGNLVTFGYGPDNGRLRLKTVTDSLGRVVTISNSQPTVITYEGFGGADRTVKVHVTSLGSSTLRPGFGVRTVDSLFPGLNNPDAGLPSTPQVIHSVQLPDGRSYQFKYNDYAELARVVLPTGGAIEYDYAPGLTDEPPSGSGMFTVNVNERQVYRRVVERRVYPDGGGSGMPSTAYRVKQVYSRPESSLSNEGYVDVRQCTSASGVGVCDIAATRLNWERHYYDGSPRASFALQPYHYNSWRDGKEKQTDVYDPQSGGLLRKVENRWEQPVNGATWPITSVTAETSPGARPNNPQVTQVLTTLGDTNQVSRKTFSYDQYGNQTDVYEYDYGAAGSGSHGAFLRRSHTDFVTASAYVNAAADPAAGSGLRGLPLQQWVSSDEAGASSNRVSLTEYEYDDYASDSRHAPLVPRTNITWLCPTVDAQNQCVTSGAASHTVRGNLTGVTTYADAAAKSGAVTASKQYDVAGNVVKSIDAMSYETQVSYDDRYCNGGQGCDGAFTPNTFAFPTGTTSPVPDVSTLYGHPAGMFGSTQPLTGSTVYDFHTGLTYSTTDANGKTTTLSYKDEFGNTDPLDRPRAVTRPDLSRTDIYYSKPDEPSIYVRTLADLDATRRVESYQFYDGLGRPVRSFLNEGGTPASFITADTEYDAMGRAWRMSSPYRTNGSGAAVNPSGRWAETTFDALGRVKQEKTTADGATVTTSYRGPRALVADQDSVRRISRTDALGRIAEVWEVTPDDSAKYPGVEPAPSAVTEGLIAAAAHGYMTEYAYNLLGNLKRVTQGAQPARVFVYDSLGRLASASNPESGAVNYTYDLNGNLETRSDARGVTATYKYDRLNRNIITTYSGGGTTTPEVRRFYDNVANGLGRQRRSEVAGVSASEIVTYDLMGRPKQQRQSFWVNNGWGQEYAVLRSYNLAGGVTSQTYPSGHTVNYNYDAAGRLGDSGSQPALAGNLGDGVARTYASAISYSEFGGIQEERFGTQTPLYHKLHYNVRGQLYDIRLSTVAWAADEWEWNRGAVVNNFDRGCQWKASDIYNNGNLRCSEYAVPLDPNASYTPGAVGAYATSLQSYAYDALNRLTGVTERKYATGGAVTQAFTQAYKYDRWGNRTVDLGLSQGAPVAQYDFERGNLQSTNRLYAPGDLQLSMPDRRMQYDAAGNLTRDGYTGEGGRVYDAENRMTEAAVDEQGNRAYYSYDAGGLRVKRKIVNEEWWQVYGMGGELLAEYRAGAATYLPSKEYGYRGGELLVTMSSGDDQRLRRFVQNLYYGALQRDPTAQELQDKTNALAASGAQGEAQLLQKAREIARALFVQTAYETSPARSDVQYVTDLYYAYMHRAPDTPGLNNWTAAAAGGVTNRSNVCNAFQESAEFSALVSTLYGEAESDGERRDRLIHVFHLGAYGRIANSTELGLRRGQLDVAAALGQDEVKAKVELMGRELFAAQVSDLSLPAGQFVTNLYESFLQRGPDAGGLAHWTAQAGNTAQSRQLVLNAFAGCDPFRELAGTLYRETFWMVSDHLGTPRMLADRTGSLAGIKRRDYLPFGEELFAGMGGRTTGQGYSFSDGVRQGFTGYEKDGETQLNYARARYQSPAQGRFTSPDPLLASGKAGVPQSWNRYTYCLSNPLLYVDPDGLIWGTKGDDPNYKWFETKDAMEAEGYAAATRFVYEVGGVWYAVNPGANDHKKFTNSWDARVQHAKWTGLPDSNWDYVPGVRGARSFLFNYTIGNFEGAFADFMSLSVEGGAAGVGGGAARGASAAKSVADDAARLADDTYEIIDGVRRAKAGELLGKSTIRAEIRDIDGKITGVRELPIDRLLAPFEKSKIDVGPGTAMDRWMRVFEPTKSNTIRDPIAVTPGKQGIPIKDVGFGAGEP